MLRAVGRAAAALALLGLTGCFVYVPAQLDAVPPGETVRLRLNGSAPSELAEVSPDAGRVLRGTLVRRDPDKLFVRVPVATRQQGFESQTIAQEVGIAPSQIVEVEMRRRSGSRTVLLVAGTGAAAAVVIGTIIQGRGARDDEVVEPPSEIRIPLGN